MAQGNREAPSPRGHADQAKRPRIARERAREAIATTVARVSGGIADLQFLGQGLQFQTKRAAGEDQGQTRDDGDEERERDQKFGHALAALISRRCGHCCCAGFPSPA